MSAWLLPDHIADVLPADAQCIERRRRQLIDVAARQGYELVIPPLVEHIESLLTGSGEALDLQTFKLVDLLSGRSLGVRADTTQQAARIDAHLLNRHGVTRLCYCGPVLHTRPQAPGATREPLQFGAELYGSASVQADLEILSLALQALQATQAVATEPAWILDLADARLVPALLGTHGLAPATVAAIHAALSTKNAEALSVATSSLPRAEQEALASLLDLYGPVPAVLKQARSRLPSVPRITQALDELQWLADRVGRAFDGVVIHCDLADARGYAYYSGMRFAIYAQGCHDALVRGGRYDAVGAVFGRERPAVGFSLDVKTLCAQAQSAQPRRAIQARWDDDASWREAVAQLRASGETVVVRLPDLPSAADAFCCDRELVREQGNWMVKPLEPAHSQL